VRHWCGARSLAAPCVSMRSGGRLKAAVSGSAGVCWSPRALVAWKRRGRRDGARLAEGWVCRQRSARVRGRWPSATDRQCLPDAEPVFAVCAIRPVSATGWAIRRYVGWQRRWSRAGRRIYRVIAGRFGVTVCWVGGGERRQRGRLPRARPRASAGGDAKGRVSGACGPISIAEPNCAGRTHGAF
jgi:hypothetical protein